MTLNTMQLRKDFGKAQNKGKSQFQIKHFSKLCIQITLQ